MTELEKAKPDDFPSKESLDELLYAMRTSEVLKLCQFDYRKGFTDALDIIVRWLSHHDSNREDYIKGLRCLFCGESRLLEMKPPQTYYYCQNCHKHPGKRRILKLIEIEDERDKVERVHTNSSRSEK